MRLHWHGDVTTLLAGDYRAGYWRGPDGCAPEPGDGPGPARGRHPGRGKVPERITGTGEDELAAMTDLRIRLDERQRAEKLIEIDRRGRAAFLEGAEDRSQAAEGRPLTDDELEHVTKHYRWQFGGNPPVADVCEHCDVPLRADSMVVYAMEPVEATNDYGDRHLVDGEVVFVLQDHWTETNAKGWRALDRGEYRKFRPAG